MKIRKLIPILLATLPLATQAWFMPYPKPAGKYPQANAADDATATSKLQTLWNSWKGGNAGSGRVPNNVSEGSGYAMLMAVMMNDRTAFLQSWEAAEKQLWVSNDGSPTDGWYAWKPNPKTEGEVQAASDADEDIALALVTAAALVKSGNWPATSVTFTYNRYSKTSGQESAELGPVTFSVENRAISVIASIERYMTSSVDMAFKGTAINHFTHSSLQYPLKNVAGAEVTLYNPSYFSPGWYRIFQDFLATERISSAADWNTVIANGYTMIRGQPNYSRGMARDWSDETGKTIDMPFFHGGGGCGLFCNVNSMTYDAIRTPYRIGMDAYLFGGADAKAYVSNAAGTSPAMYSGLDGSPSAGPEVGTPMSVGMWGAAFAGGAAVGNATAKTSLATAWGNWKSGNEGDYFKGALFILGGLVMSGNFPNVWADLKSSFPDTVTHITTALKATPSIVPLGTSTRLTATASKAVTWKVYAKSRVAGATGGSFLVTTPSTKLDTAWFTSRLSGLKAGDLVDAKVYWPGGLDTSFAVITIGPGTGVLKSVRQDLVIRAGSNQLSIQVPDASGSAVQVRVLDLQGREIRTLTAQPVQGSLELPLAGLSRGTQMLEIVDRDMVHRGLIPVIR